MRLPKESMTAGGICVMHVDDIIPLIYQGPLETTPWQSFMGSLRQRLSCDIAAMTLRIRYDGNGPLSIYVGHNPGDGRDFIGATEQRKRQDAISQLCRNGHADPLGDKLRQPGDIYALSEIISADELRKTLYYQLMMQPYGIEHQLGMCFGEPSGWRCNLGLMSGAERDFGSTEKEFLVFLRPHLERALELYARIKRFESEKLILQETLDRLTIGTFILDCSGRIIDVNSAASRIVREGDCVRITKERLTLARSADNEHLAKTIKAALSWQEAGREAPFVDALRAKRNDGTYLGFLVRTVTAAGEYRSSVSPTVVVYVCDPTQQTMPTERLVAQLFGLSPGEAELATLLASGFTLIQAAEKLNVTENTIRSYAKRTFGKFGVSRQTDLVRLMLTSVAPLAGVGSSASH